MHYIRVECDHLVIAWAQVIVQVLVVGKLFGEFEELICFTNNCVVFIQDQARMEHI